MKVIHDFLTADELAEVLTYQPPSLTNSISNEHIRSVNAATNGTSILCDLTHSPVSIEISKYQGDATEVEDVPSIFWEVGCRIAGTLDLDPTNVFFQHIVLGENGEVRKHYDAGKPGYITYKCNVYVAGQPDLVYVDGVKHDIVPGDLYCFEANLYKHWMGKAASKRIHLSYGFIVSCDKLGWDISHPRVRLSNRIWKAYINA